MPDDVLGRPLTTRPDVPRLATPQGDDAGILVVPASVTPVDLVVSSERPPPPSSDVEPRQDDAPEDVGTGSAVDLTAVEASAPDGVPSDEVAATGGTTPGSPADAASTAVGSGPGPAASGQASSDEAAPPPVPPVASEAATAGATADDVGPAPAPEQTDPGVVDGWWATLAAAPLPDTLLGDGDLAADGLDLTHAHPSGLATLLAGRPTRLSSLVRERAAHAAARARARSIRAGVQHLASERGVRAGFLALGMVTWWPADDDRRRDGRGALPVRAPLLLRGCTLNPRGAGHQDFELVLEPSATVNPEVLRRLRDDHDVRLDSEALSGLAFGPEGFDPSPVYTHLEDRCHGVPGFLLDRRLVLGSFTPGSGALLADLDAAVSALRVHPVLGPIVTGRWRGPTGDRMLAERAAEAARAALGREPEPRPRPFTEDDGTPDPVLSVLPLDPAQRRAVRAVRDGGSLVVTGPPGTGRTQTLAAAVVALVETGRRVLVVTPHRSSARTLASRVAGAGLRDAVLDLHDGYGDQTALLSALSSDLESAASGAAVERAQRGVHAAGDGDVQAVGMATSVLAGESAALHEVRAPWEVSAYDAMEALAELMAADAAPRTKVRLGADACAGLDAATRERLRADLRTAAELGAFTLTRRDTRWLDAAVTNDAEVAEALTAAETAREMLPTARSLMAGVAEAAGLEEARTVAQWAPHLELLQAVRGTLDVMLPTVYEQPLDDLVAGLRAGPDRPGLFARASLRRRAKALVRPGVHVKDVLPVLLEVSEQRARWQAAAPAGGWPRVPVGLAAAGEAVDVVLAALTTLGRYLEGTGCPDLTGMPLDQLARRLKDLTSDADSLTAQPRRSVLVTRLREAGLGPLVDDLRERRCTAADVDGELDLAWWTSVLDTVVRNDPRLRRHDPGRVGSALDELRSSADRLAAAGLARVRGGIAARAKSAVEAHPDQVRWLRHEVRRAHRSQWPTDLFRRSADVVRALRPVIVMSPDAVARCLPAAVAARPFVDVVVVDDAGQVGMPEAAAALARGQRIVVAGDPRGLPAASGRPSVLEALTDRIPGHVLDRDHRTRDGRLLAPAQTGHRGVWAVTPGPTPTAPLALEIAEPRPLPDVDHLEVELLPEEEAPPPTLEDPVTAELRRTVELVTEHAARRPGESLLVVTLGQRYADRIEAALRAEVAVRPELARWLEVHWTGRIAESFVVRPVHRLCGLERDAVIVSLGLGRAANGGPPARFGVIDGPFGRACLVAAFTRSRRRTTVVTAFRPQELDPDLLRSDGAHALREILAEVGDPVSHDRRTTSVGPVVDPLVTDLRDRLLAVGLPVGPGVDAPDWPLPLVVGDPSRPGQLLLAVDVDSEEHARCAGVVVRDVARREAFERAGWSYVRVSAMDLFCEPAGAVDRIRRAWRNAGGRGVHETATTGLVIVGRPKVRASRPEVPPGRQVDEYSEEQLRRIAVWILTDGIPRGTDELAAAVCEDLQLVVRRPRVLAQATAVARSVLAGGTLGS